MKMNWNGVIPAMTTQFKADYSVDHAAIAKHAQWLIKNGCTGSRDNRRGRNYGGPLLRHSGVRNSHDRTHNVESSALQRFLVDSNRSHPLKKRRQREGFYGIVAKLADDLTDATRCT